MEKLKKNEYWEMDYQDLETLIEKHLGFNPELIANWEMQNDSYKAINISKKLDSGDEEDLQKMLKNNGTNTDYFSTELFMSELCRRKILPEGNYLISICW